MSQITSSGKQLHSLLHQAWSREGKSPAREVWAAVLGGNSNNGAEISEKLSYFIELFNDVRDDIKSLENTNIHKYLRTLDFIQTVLMNQALLDAQWQTIKSQISQDSLDLVESCGEAIESRNKGVCEVTPEELQDLQKIIKDLTDEILNSEIDIATKGFLVNELRKIEDVILNYRIRGSNGLVKVSEEVAGKILVRWSKFLDPAKEAAGKVAALVLTIGRTNRDVESAGKLAGNLKNWIDSGVEVIKHFLV